MTEKVTLLMSYDFCFSLMIVLVSTINGDFYGENVCALPGDFIILLCLCHGLFVCFCCFTSHVNSYGHCGMVSSLNHTFSWAGLSKRLTSNLCTYFRL